MPFRTLQTPDGASQAPSRREAPTLMAFSLGTKCYRLAFEAAGVVSVLELDRVAGVLRARTDTPVLDAGGGRAATCTPDGWAVVAECDGSVLVWRDGHGETAISLAPAPVSGAARRLLGAAVEGAPCVATMGREIDVVSVRGADVARVPVAWTPPGSARELIAFTSNVYGPVAIFATDRDDEVDVCAAGHGGEPVVRTVSLGWRQRFECAAGGGARVLIVSRDAEGVVARTLASDVRSELNPVPLRPRTGWRVEGVRAHYANGVFVVAHEERAGDERAVVVTVFDDGATRSSRLAMPGVHALAADGKDLAVAALEGGASGPLLIVQRMLVSGSDRRCYVYLLGDPACGSVEQRRAVLADVAQAIALSLGAAAPHELALRAHDERSDVATFTLPGASGARAFALLLRDDGSGVVTIRLGELPVAPRGLNFVERLRVMFTGDDDGDPKTTRLDVDSLRTAVAQVVTAVGTLVAIS